MSAACAYALDVNQGYNFNKDNNSPCGFVTKLKIGDTEFEADQEVNDISSPDSKLKVVSVLRNFEWDTAITGPVYFEMQLSPKGKQAAKLLQLKTMNKVDIEITYVLYEFDPADGAQVFYEAVHTNKSPLKGVVQKNGSNFVFGIAGEESSEVPTPKNYLFRLGFEAQGEQEMHLATSKDDKFVKQIGMNLS